MTLINPSIMNHDYEVELDLYPENFEPAYLLDNPNENENLF